MESPRPHRRQAATSQAAPPPRGLLLGVVFFAPGIPGESETTRQIAGMQPHRQGSGPPTLSMPVGSPVSAGVLARPRRRSCVSSSPCSAGSLRQRLAAPQIKTGLPNWPSNNSASPALRKPMGHRVLTLPHAACASCAMKNSLQAHGRRNNGLVSPLIRM